MDAVTGKRTQLLSLSVILVAHSVPAAAVGTGAFVRSSPRSWSVGRRSFPDDLECCLEAILHVIRSRLQPFACLSFAFVVRLAG